MSASQQSEASQESETATAIRTGCQPPDRVFFLLPPGSLSDTHLP
ncbi:MULTISPECIES: hypothetical protein [Pantoea]|nr:MULTISPECIES: hypothetical protein [Pantoea]